MATHFGIAARYTKDVPLRRAIFTQLKSLGLTDPRWSTREKAEAVLASRLNEIPAEMRPHIEVFEGMNL
jgi:hypothetical protein